LTVDREGIGARSAYTTARTREAIAALALDASEQDELTRFTAAFRKAGRSGWEQPQRRSFAEYRRVHGIPTDKRLVFVPAQVGRDVSTLIHSPRFADNGAWLRHLLDASAGRDDLFFLVKPHPKEELAETWMRDWLAGRGLWDPDLHVHDALAACDVVACLNSSVGLESILMERPVAAGALAFWTGHGLSFDVLANASSNASSKALAEFLGDSPPLDPRRREAFLWHFLTQAVYGDSTGPWRKSADLAARLMTCGVERAVTIKDAERKWRDTRDWMRAMESASLAEEAKASAGDRLKARGARLGPLFA
jgi:hypothetical protein